MAEPEELDEDLFADIYDAEDNEPNDQNAAVENNILTEPAPNQDGGDAGMSGVDNSGGAPQTSNEQSQVFDGSAQPESGSIVHGNMFMSENDTHVPEPEHTGIAIKEDGKMFIGGLNWETTDESLRHHFEEFGEVAECTVMRDAATGRSRGFGFLTFKDPKVVNIVMVKEHYLDGKIIDPKRAIPRDEQERTSKIFVGGVSQEATDEDFRNYFMQYGRVIDATLMMDKDTKRPRGFGFVTFDSEAAVEATLRGDLMIHGKPIEVKRAQPRGNVQPEEDQSRRGGPGGRRAGFRGDEQGGAGASGGGGAGAQNNPMFQNGMTPQMMAQYFQRMQQYFASMMAAGMGGGGGMMGGMNPAMMQQMKQMQQMQAMQGGGGGASQMSPQMMQQMQQMQQMQMQQMQQGNQGGVSPSNQGNMNGNNGGAAGVPTGPSSSGGAPRRGNSNAGQQEQIYQQPSRRGGNQNMGYQQGDPTSWEGMYDDVPQPDGAPGGGRGGYGRGGGWAPPKGPSAAPANAPTGPKNAGQPGANYRGGGRGHRRGYHPYGGRR